MTPFEPARALQGAPGFMLVDPNTEMNVYTPSWHDPTYFLPVGSPQPGMSSTDDDNWYHHVPDLVRSVGSRRRISFLNSPSDMPTSDVEPTPYDLLRDTVWTMSIDTHPHWQRLFIRNGYRRPALSNPNWALLIQGMLYGYPNMPFWKAPIGNAVMALSPQLAMSLQTMLQDDDAVEQLFAPGVDSGDPSGARPSVMRFYQHWLQARVPDDWDLVREPVLQPPSRQGNERSRILCQIVRPATGVHISCPSTTERALAIRPWSKLIRRLTVAQQLRCLATAFDPELIRAVFTGSRYEPYLPRWVAEAREAESNPVG
tara:strand:- start:2 stop:946 length:945 start_codon:yes stop_codon:yes gene_type:complete